MEYAQAAELTDRWPGDGPCPHLHPELARCVVFMEALFREQPRHLHDPEPGSGISQQPDSQRDLQPGGSRLPVSSIAEGLRKRDNTVVVAKVSDTPFGRCVIHSILRDQQEEYLSVITNSSIRCLTWTAMRRMLRPMQAPCLSEFCHRCPVADQGGDDRGLHVRLQPDHCCGHGPALAPETPRPSPHECLIWVKAANYGQTGTANVNGKQAEAETLVAPVVSSGGPPPRTASIQGRSRSRSSTAWGLPA